MITANIMTSTNNIQDICKANMITIITAIALHINLTILESNSMTLSGSVYNLLINSPTPISSNAIAGSLSIFWYKSLLTFFVNFISKYV